jgi:hypothetical protein
MNLGRWRGGRSSDSDGRSLHNAGLGQPAGPRHSMALNGVGRRTPAWARLNQVEGGDSRRTGPSRTMIQDVPLEVGHVYVPTDTCNGTILQRFVTLLYIRIELNRLHIRFPVHPMVIASDTIAHSCGKPRIRSNTHPVRADDPSALPPRPPRAPRCQARNPSQHLRVSIQVRLPLAIRFRMAKPAELGWIGPRCQARAGCGRLARTRCRADASRATSSLPSRLAALHRDRAPLTKDGVPQHRRATNPGHPSQSRPWPSESIPAI